ncbi:MAG: hypothetical protein MRZ79_22560 [Bacteroidia bacterium]|nr:hypothetical protein [Bacteroidia bacterium]
MIGIHGFIPRKEVACKKEAANAAAKKTTALESTIGELGVPPRKEKHGFFTLIESKKSTLYFKSIEKMRLKLSVLLLGLNMRT